MAFQIRPDRADDSSAPNSSAFREFSIYSLPDLAGPAVATHLNSGFSQATRPYRGCIAVQSALIRSLLLVSPLRVPLKRDLPKPFPRLCVRQSLICYG